MDKHTKNNRRIRSLIIMVCNYCNCRCSMCNVWENSNREEISARQVEDLFALNDLSEVEELNITGGEPTLIPSVKDLLSVVIKSARNLRRLIISTNGTSSDAAEDIVRRFVGQLPELILHVSIEGRSDIHNSIRGVSCYHSAVDTLARCSRYITSGYGQAISTTLHGHNCTFDNLVYLHELAASLHSTLTFRFAGISEVYYGNVQNRMTPVTDGQINEAIRFIDMYCASSKFASVLRDKLSTGRVPPMRGSSGQATCGAGELYAFVRPDGSIYPCFNSNTKIGSITDGITVHSSTKGGNPQCPCCTEGHVYPVLKFGEAASDM